MDIQRSDLLPPATAQTYCNFVYDIERAADRLGHRRGWRFLCVPRAVLAAPVEVAFITLNPGLAQGAALERIDSCENGVAYLAERWEDAAPGLHKLQVQVQLLFAALNNRLRRAADGDRLMAQSLLGYFVPFRAARFAELPQAAESLSFGRELWQRVLALAAPRLIVCMDRETHGELQAILDAVPGQRCRSTCSYPTGWGKCTADLTTYGEARTVRLLRLPQLATFQLFTNRNCNERLRRILDDACTGLRPAD